VYLKNEAYKQLDLCLRSVSDFESGVKSVCVTHMPFHSKDERYLPFCSNPRYLDFIAEKFDYLFVGHSHQNEDFVYVCESPDDSGTLKRNYLRIINAGTNFDKISGGYNKPNFVIVDII
jgi:hypothetical protein